MEFLFGLVTFWFVMGAALFIRDASRASVGAIGGYFLWPKHVWSVWLPK